jgi:putative sterol carrier protein
VAKVQFKIAGSPEPDDPEADLVVTMNQADYTAFQAGELDPNVAFMQGRLKFAGSTGLFIELVGRARPGS